MAISYILHYQDYQNKDIYYLKDCPQCLQLRILIIQLSSVKVTYTGNIHTSFVNDNVPFVMPLDSALERLQQQMFGLFILTVEYNTVSIFTDSNGLLKVFDSHARDSFGMPHPHRICVLLEFDSISDLTGYFKQLCRLGAIFEVKDVKVNDVCNEILQNVDKTMICFTVAVIVTQK